MEVSECIAPRGSLKNGKVKPEESIILLSFIFIRDNTHTHKRLLEALKNPAGSCRHQQSRASEGINGVFTVPWKQEKSRKNMDMESGDGRVETDGWRRTGGDRRVETDGW